MGTAAVLGGTALAGGIASYLGGREAAKATREGQKRQEALQREAMAKLEAVGVPSIEAQQIVLKDPQLIGEYIPEMEGIAKELSSSMASVEVDPRLKEAQMQQLSAIQERTSGLTPQDLIEIRSAREDIAGQLKSQDADIVRNLQQRGLGGAGAEIAMRQAQGQSAMRQASEEADRLAAMQHNARMQAAQQAGSLASQMRGQQFSEESQKAQSVDAMNKFNLMNQMNTNQRNIASRNAAQAANLQAKQQIANQITGNRNQETIHNKALLQQQFENEFRKAGGQASQSNAMASSAAATAANQAANKQAMWQGISNALTGAGMAAAKYK